MNGRIRIIGGQWRGRRLSVPDRAGLRPTGDRVRETLFNWLQVELPGARCLDLFAGTGVLGLEAASRGAVSVVMVERDRSLVDSIREAVVQWPGGQVVEVVHGDALAWLDGASGVFDVVFIDPPFGSGLQQLALDRLVSGGLLSNRARIYVEQGIDETAAEHERLQVLRDKRMGRVRARLLGPD